MGVNDLKYVHLRQDILGLYLPHKIIQIWGGGKDGVEIKVGIRTMNLSVPLFHMYIHYMQQKSTPDLNTSEVPITVTIH